MTPSGNWMLAWSSSGQDGSGQGVYAQIIDSAGTPVGGEFRVNTTTSGDQKNASVTTDQYGNYYIIWQSYNQDSASTWGIYGQQLTSAGKPIEKEFKVNSTISGDQVNPATAMDSSGHLVVTWNGNGLGGPDAVYMQRYSVNTALESPPEGDVWNPNGDGTTASGRPAKGAPDATPVRHKNSHRTDGPVLPSRCKGGRSATSDTAITALDAYLARLQDDSLLTALVRSHRRTERLLDLVSAGLAGEARI